jgi:hypothetical protein
MTTEDPKAAYDRAREKAHGETVTTLEHIVALREIEAKYESALHLAEEKFQNERDRRYAEVKNAEEKALKVKEEADRTALSLAREIQTYKDEKANELRSQIERERGSYATQGDLKGAIEKLEATVKPLADWIASQQGRTGGLNAGWGYLVGAIGVIATVISLVILLTRH